MAVARKITSKGIHVVAGCVGVMYASSCSSAVVTQDKNCQNKRSSFCETRQEVSQEVELEELEERSCDAAQERSCDAISPSCDAIYATRSPLVITSMPYG